MSRNLQEILRRVSIGDIPLAPVARVEPSTSLEEVYGHLDAGYPAVLVCDRGAIVGIFTERDVLYRTALESVDPASPVAAYMTRSPTTLERSARLAEAIVIMTREGYRNIPLEPAPGRPAGMVTSRDVLGFIAGFFPESVLNLPPRLRQVLVRPEGG